MTNREKILAELSAMDNATLYRVLNENRVTTAMERGQCEDCMREEPCPLHADDGGECRLDTLDWMDMPCTHTRIIGG